MSYSYDQEPYIPNSTLREMCYAAMDRLDKKMLQFQCWPEWEVIIKTEDFTFGFPMCADEPKGIISFTFPRNAFTAMLQRKCHWNNLEVGCHLKIHREPNEYCPDVHTLLSFFHI